MAKNSTTTSTTATSTTTTTSAISSEDRPTQTINLVNQLVIRARLNQHDSDTNPCASSQALQLVMCIKLSIPYSIIPLPGSPDLTLPLMPDRNLRLCHSHVFPLSRRSSKSKPIIQASNQTAQLTASVLNLSKSFPGQNLKLPKPPAVSVVVRNFTISLVVSPSFLPSRNPSIGHDPRSPVAEYAIALDCWAHWNTTGPSWPSSITIPTPPCLKNSFWLLLPNDLTEEPESPALHLTTFPPLRRERWRYSTLSNTMNGGAQSAVLSDEDLRPLSDESEPEGISSLPDEGDELDHDHSSNWPQDERSPRIEGVFQSTKQLCIILGHGSQNKCSPFDYPITAKRASSRLSVSVGRSPTKDDTESPSVSLDLNFHVDLEQVGTQSINTKTPLVLTIPHQVANQFVSARWSPMKAEGLIQTSFPPTIPGKEIPHSDSLVTTDQLSPISSSSSIDLTFVPNTDEIIPEFELLNTSAPFSKFESGVRADTTAIEAAPDFKLDESAQSEKMESDIPYQFVAWFDTEWLLRSAAISHNQLNLRLALTLHGQLDLAIVPSTLCNGPKSTFPIPFFILPSAEEQICSCQVLAAPTDISSRQEVELNLPPWANSLESSADRQIHQFEFRLENSTHTQTMDSLIMAHLHQFGSTQVNGTAVTTPERKPTQTLLGESSVSIGTLIISPAGRIRHHSRRSTISNISFANKRPRCSFSLKNRTSKNTPMDDQKKPDPTEPHPKVTASIRSVQLDLVIDSSSSSSHLTQYGEFSINLSRPIGVMVDPWVNTTFRIKPEDTVEVLGAWIGDRELARYEGFECSEEMESDNETAEAIRVVSIKFNVPDICISGKLESSELSPILRLIVKYQIPNYKLKTEPLNSNQSTQKTKDGPIFCLLPLFDSSVGIYKVSVQICATFQLLIERTNMLILEKSSNMTKLIQYSLPPNAINQTSVTIKPINAELSGDRPVVGSGHDDQNHSRDREARTVNRLSWSEYYTLKWGVNFKILLLCWLLYLVSFMSIQLDEMGARLDVLHQQQSQQISTHPVKIQAISQVADPHVELKQNPSVSQQSYEGIKSQILHPSINDQFESLSNLKETEVETDQPHYDHLPPPSKNELFPDYFLGFLHPFLPYSILDPLSKCIKKLHLFNNYLFS